MSWNYRIVRRETKDGPVWELHEVYYEENGTPKYRTQQPVGFGSDDGPEDVIRSLEMALVDARTRVVLDDPWPEEVG